MRVERRQDAWFARGVGAAACVSLTGIGAALARGEGALLGALAGVGTAVVMERAASRRGRRRRAALAAPFPDKWRRWLADEYDHYDRLPEPLRRRLEDDVRLFLAEKRITGIGIAVDDELRLMVAASAVTLSLGWSDFEWDVLTEVLLYPQDFTRDYGFEDADLAGQAHPWGTVILSVPALRQSFADPDDAFHVGFHEFAHLIDLADESRMEGIPTGLSPAQQREWAGLMEKEMEKLQRGRSVIDEYGADEPAEFFAVAVEAFFECSLLLRKKHAALYTFLARYFAQDPAAWDDTRGLYL